MPKKKHPLQFDIVKDKLQELHAQALSDIHSPENANDPAKRGAALKLNRQIEAAMECLEFCERYKIQPHVEVTTLPDTVTRTPSSNYRICEDHESNDLADWKELKIDDRPFYLYPGDLVISM